MANDITGNPLIIDTAASTDITTAKLNVLHFAFANYTDKTHTVVVRDSKGRDIWYTAGATDLPTIHSSEVGLIEGLRVTTLGSGKLFVYLK